MMTDKEAIELFEKVHFIDEQIDMKDDIENIRNVLSQIQIEESDVRKQIETINRKHPENIVLFNLIFPPQGNTMPLYSAPLSSLISDLNWKLIYLQAKKEGKLFDELRKTIRQIMQDNQNGG